MATVETPTPVGLLGCETLLYDTTNDGRRALSFSSKICDATIYITPNPDNGSIHIHLVEECEGAFTSTCSASGTLTFLEGCVYVNGCKNGRLKDRYGDGFDVPPQEYMHLLNLDSALFNPSTMCLDD
jgi:hypothetical protein